MKTYIKHNPWQIIEDTFRPEHNEFSESIFAIGNGRMGQRANFEEDFSGKSLQGSYLAGIYYPDKTRVGWWKNGYPEYFAKVINSVDWIGLHILVNGQVLDLAKAKVTAFERRLDMQQGMLYRSFVVEMPDGVQIKVEASRMYHLFASETASLQYRIAALSDDITLTVTSRLNAEVTNRDSNYDEKFWESVGQGRDGDGIFVAARTKKTGFEVYAMLETSIKTATVTYGVQDTIISSGCMAEVYSVNLAKSQTCSIEKRVAIVTSQNHAVAQLKEVAHEHLRAFRGLDFDQLKEKQAAAWQTVWAESDIEISGDVAAQQAIRYNIFQLNQTYTGEDERLNIGPKGFTGEKYGGVTYWDTEAYCIPFYLATQSPKIARNLLIYRHQQLDKAIENAAKLGFDKGAALYPMVTINGEECHNEWEITFEEIHRNGAIAFAIYNYVRYTGDEDYIWSHGLEVLVAISRFWAQRVNWSAERGQYVMLGVTGPNEYENNVNNNWYTNRIASWCLEYTLECLKKLEQPKSDNLSALKAKLAIGAEEQQKWQHIIDNMYYPFDAQRNVYLQQDGFLDKELIPVAQLDSSQRPINQHWSWDRILRSCYIKQADVLQGFYFLEDQFDRDTLSRHYEFYEPLTVHESSLSPCVHAILAAKLNKAEKAYEFYLRTSRLDLDDYNNDTEDGLHITSMAGTWMTIVEGFAGMRIKAGKLYLNPMLPKEWEGYKFRVLFRGSTLLIAVHADGYTIENISDTAAHIQTATETFILSGLSKKQVPQVR
ncbi:MULTISPECIES: family 65 glycosyl hydrolase domain-containing protein [Sphingobacterium]|uniref:family 65 glycosyl hydrolase domain-containing protein n=1 Tax=Sphingobacterium TaxID=28453 RepID=UPI00257EE8BB|nr:MULTISPECIES: family 65 glycosyl hydrolase domain-containing protein [Sphingobacterium]